MSARSVFAGELDRDHGLGGVTGAADCFQRHQLWPAVPPDYQWFQRSFDGLDVRFLAKIRKHAPGDYARILEWFPLAELELHRAAL